MNRPSTEQLSASAKAEGLTATIAEVDASCRVPLLVLFVSSAKWLVIASILGLIATLKLHTPHLLADCAWLTYGRVHPAWTNAILYGFGVQAGLGVTLWLFARLGRVQLALPVLATFGAALWNLGVTVGILGILAGDATGFENLEMPGYASFIVFLGYLLLASVAVLTFHHRSERQLYVSHWFLLTALFWFAWIYSTANLLLVQFPGRGMVQPVIAWWYSNNLQVVWMWLVGLGTAFYFIPRLTNRVLHSHYLALCTFWLLIFFGSWGGVPNSAAVPAWIPALSTMGTVLTTLPILMVVLNIHSTLEGDWKNLCAVPALKYIGFGLVAFVIAGLMNVAGSLMPVSQITDFTWFTVAKNQFNNYGFFAVALIGAIYYITPHLVHGLVWSPKLVSAQFIFIVLGVLFGFVPLAIGGVVQGFQSQDPSLQFLDLMNRGLMFLWVSSLGDIFLLIAHLVFAVNLIGLMIRFYQSRAEAAYTTVTADLFKQAEVKP